MKKRIGSLLLALLMLCTLLPQSVLPVSASGDPDVFRYQGEEYRLITVTYLDLYQVGTPYLFVTQYDGNYYALGSDLSAVALTLTNSELSAAEGVAVLTSVPQDGRSNLDSSLPLLVNGSKYLMADGSNVLSLSDTAPDPYCGWAITDNQIRCWIDGEAWNSYHYLDLPDGAAFGLSSSKSAYPILVYQKVCDHAGKTDYPAVAATCTAPGRQACAYCPTCGSWLDASGERSYDNGYGAGLYWEDDFVILPTGHHYENGACTNDAEHEARVYELVTSDDMIVPGDEYRYLLVSEDGKTVGIDGTKEYDNERLTVSGTTAVEGGLMIDNSGDPAGVFAVELKLVDFSENNDDPGLTLPEDGSQLFVPVTDESFVMLLQGELCMVYDDSGNAKYPVGVTVSNGIASVRSWNYGDWGQPVAYDAQAGFALGDAANIKLYRGKLAGTDPQPGGMKVALIADEGGVEDGGFNQQVHEAAKAWCEANNVAYAAYVFDDSYNTEQEAYGVGIVEKAISEGATVLILPGFSFTEATANTAAQYPDVTYILLDVDEYSLLDAMGDENAEIPANVYLATYREEQAGYLAGYAAVALGYEKLAFLGGPEFPGITRYGFGFVQGADAAAQALQKTDAIRIDFVYTGQFAPDDYMTDYVSNWFQNGTEIVFACGGGIWVSAAQAAADNNGKVIGVDADQKDQIDGFGDGIAVSSAIKNLGATAVRQLDQILAGTFVGGREEHLGIVSLTPAENPVGLAPSTQFNDLFDESDYAGLVAQIYNGQIEPSDDVDNRPETTVFVDYNCYRGHDWNEPTYEWAEDNSTVTATRVCKNEDYHVETETAPVTVEVTTPATCGADGACTYSATFTNEAFEPQTKTGTIPATGQHTPGEPVKENETAPTCTEKGGYDMVVYCTVCQAELSREHTEIDLIDHSFGEWIENTEDATYEGHYRVCAVCGFRETGAHEWNDGEVTTEPTCAEPGVKTYTCTVCGATKTEEIPATGQHTPGEPVKENEVAPTCTEPGGYDMVVYCTVCQAELSREHTEIDLIDHSFGDWIENTEDATYVGHYRVCAVCGFRETGAHEWDDGEVTTEPTCAEPGVKTYTCTVCGATKTEEIEPTGQHTPGEPVKENEVAPTCTEPGGYDEVVYCTVCQAELSREHVEIPAAGHTPGEPVKENEVAPTCTEPGGYDEVVYCTVCQAELSREHVEIPAAGHTPGEPVKENEVAPTCLEPGSYDEVVYCTVCQAELSRAHVDVEAAGHDWDAVSYVWSEDNKTVTATRVCKTDAAHVETETVKTTSEETVPPTEETEGTLVYTATFENPAFETQTKSITLEKLYNPFKDIKTGDYFYRAVLWAVENGVTAGTDASHFSPNDKCTRGQVVTFLWRAKGSPNPNTTTNPFRDVSAKDYYYKAVLWAVENGVTAGTSRKTFSPNQGCTRAQVVTFLYRAEGEPYFVSDSNPFKDVKAGEYYYNPVLWAVKNGITSGTSATSFSPNATCTRAQVVTFLCRAKDVEPEPLPCTELEAGFIELVNQERVARGLKPLEFSKICYDCASVRIQEIISNPPATYQTTNRPDGRPWETVFTDLGYGEPDHYGELKHALGMDQSHIFPEYSITHFKKNETSWNGFLMDARFTKIAIRYEVVGKLLYADIIVIG